MKKLLTILTVLSFGSTSSLTIVACANDAVKNDSTSFDPVTFDGSDWDYEDLEAMFSDMTYKWGEPNSDGQIPLILNSYKLGVENWEIVEGQLAHYEKTLWKNNLNNANPLRLYKDKYPIISLESALDQKLVEESAMSNEKPHFVKNYPTVDWQNNSLTFSIPTTFDGPTRFNSFAVDVPHENDETSPKMSLSFNLYTNILIGTVHDDGSFTIGFLEEIFPNLDMIESFVLEDPVYTKNPNSNENETFETKLTNALKDPNIIIKAATNFYFGDYLADQQKDIYENYDEVFNYLKSIYEFDKVIVTKTNWSDGDYHWVANLYWVLGEKEYSFEYNFYSDYE